ncbi:DNA-deoxyinosine glycosylase [Chakrabartyella piscis]|uniref:DNA-deoxyinosine glycosylase n=1 Tax=Chakrabartyella piscis TaxID=2918914 RepID=UPI0029585A7B|nr:DNA-deoxyinosine glycosylase [Chakrabartyella piscis]
MKNQTPQHVTHTFPALFQPDSKILILGSVPSVKSREQNFYYGHPQNRFWKILSACFDAPLPITIEEKTAFAKIYGIALYDVVESCDIIGSSDASIQNAVPTDLSIILKETGNIPIFGNGAAACKLYGKYQEKSVGYPIISLPSSSPANAAWTQDRLISTWSGTILPHL